VSPSSTAGVEQGLEGRLPQGSLATAKWGATSGESSMPWTILNFGKYQWKTLPQVLFADPDWFFWAWDAKLFDGKGDGLRAEAADVHRKATHIRIPQKGDERLVAEYTTVVNSTKLGEVEIVPALQSEHRRSFRKDVLDMSVPHNLCPRDKLGGKIFIKRLKQIIFGSKKTRMTKAKCEEFFENAGNFIL
jgi:hypothetical protein